MKFLILTLVAIILIFAGLFSFESSNIENYIGWYKSTPLEKIQLLVNNDFSSSLKKNDIRSNKVSVLVEISIVVPGSKIKRLDVLNRIKAKKFKSFA